MPHYIVKKYDKYDHDDRQQRDLAYTKRPEPGITLRNILEHGSAAGQAVDHTRKHRTHPERRNEGKNAELCHDPAVDPADDKADQDRADKTQGQRHAGDSHQCADHPTKAGHAADGKIEFIELGDRDPSVLKGLRIIGNSVGSADDINGKASSLTDVRCIFEFYEWIEFYPDMNPECELSVYVIEHREDQEFYNDCKFSEDMPGFVSICDLRYPTDADNPAEWYWGNLYLSPDENAAGFYDFVFVYEGKAIATLLTRFYNETELSDRSGVELEELMHGK